MRKIDCAHWPSLTEPIRDHGWQAKKQFGQHFLLDLNITRKIVRLARLPTGLPVVEIGPGPGGLTRALLLEHDGPIHAVEKDERFVPALRELAPAPDLQIYHQDAHGFELENLASNARQQKIAIVANLPYNIGTALLTDWLFQADSLHSLTLMFQKEVAQRLIASPGSKNYGRLSIITQLVAKAEVVMQLPARLFTPPPKIDSQLVRLLPKANSPDPRTLKKLENLTRIAFTHRRKMLLPTLAKHWNKTQLETLFNQLQITSQLRPEALAPDQFLILAKALPTGPEKN